MFPSRTLLAAAATALAFLTGSHVSLAAIHTHPVALPLAVAGARASSNATLQTALLAAINAFRASHHLPPLTLSPQQSKCSAAHSKHMSEVGMLSHDQYPADICIPHRMSSENVGAWKGNPLKAVLHIEKAEEDEGPCPHRGCPGNEFAAHGHYENLLNPKFVTIGLGIYTKHGMTWLTEGFGDE